MVFEMSRLSPFAIVEMNQPYLPECVSEIRTIYIFVSSYSGKPTMS